jgi:hypothetical protein
MQEMEHVLHMILTFTMCSNKWELEALPSNEVSLAQAAQPSSSESHKLSQAWTNSDHTVTRR